VVQEGSLQRADLDNGLEVLVLEDHRLPRVALGVTVRRGAGIVDNEQAGLAAFSAELMSRGAGERDALVLAQAVDEIGASLRVGSSWDEMSVRVTGLSRDLDRLLEILADVVLRPRFEAREADKARGEMLASLERGKDDPHTLASWNLARALYEGHRYGRPSQGVPETVAGLDAGAAQAFHRRVFVPNDAIFSAAGDVAMDDLLARVGHAFGAWEWRPVSEPGPAPPALAPPERSIVVVDRPDLVQARIALAHEVRAEEGLTYGVGSGFALRRHPGPFYVSTFTRVSEVRRTLDLVLAELERAKSDPPSEKELRDARALTAGRFSLGLETSAAVVKALVNLDVYGLPEDSLDTYRSRVRATRVEDTARMAHTLLHPERMAIVLVGPAVDIVPQVEDMGLVEVVTP